MSKGRAGKEETGAIGYILQSLPSQYINIDDLSNLSNDKKDPTCSLSPRERASNGVHGANKKQPSEKRHEVKNELPPVNTGVVDSNVALPSLAQNSASSPPSTMISESSSHQRTGQGSSSAPPERIPGARSMIDKLTAVVGSRRNLLKHPDGNMPDGGAAKNGVNVEVTTGPEVHIDGKSTAHVHNSANSREEVNREETPVSHHVGRLPKLEDKSHPRHIKKKKKKKGDKRDTKKLSVNTKLLVPGSPSPRERSGRVPPLQHNVTPPTTLEDVTQPAGGGAGVHGATLVAALTAGPEISDGDIEATGDDGEDQCNGRWEYWAPVPYPDGALLDYSVLSENPRAVIGLANLGNTCFLNSIVQCICNLPRIAAMFITGDAAAALNRETSETKGEIAIVFGTVLRKLWSGTPWSHERPEDFKEAVGRANSQFRGRQQHDAHEFLLFLVDALHEDLNRVREKVPYEELKEVEGLSDWENSERFWHHYSARHDSPIKDLFCGQLMSVLTCVHCATTSTTFDIFWDLSLPIPTLRLMEWWYGQGAGSAAAGEAGATPAAAAAAAAAVNGEASASVCELSDCLRSFTLEEQLEGSEAYFCTTCKTYCTASKKISVYRWPSILVLHLKRFGVSSQSRAKLKSVVSFPVDGLNVDEFNVSQEPELLYDLVAVSNHLGELGHGHYTADCLNPDSLAWMNFDDDQVTYTTESFDGALPYLLFYQRRGT